MKSIQLQVLAMMLLPLAMGAQEIQSDTIKVINNASAVTVTRSNNRSILKALIPDENNETNGGAYTYEINVDENNTETIYANDFSLKFPFTTNNDNNRRNVDNSRRTKRSFVVFKYMYWGWNFNYHSKAGLSNCFESGIADLFGVDWETSGKTTLGVGLGVGWNRVTTANHAMFAKTGDRLTVIPAPDDTRMDFARWDTWRFHLPLMYSQKLAYNFGFALAAIINFNTYSTATNRYMIGETRYTETIKRINMRLLTVDLMATVGVVNNIGAYVKWSPMTAMQDSYGPVFRNFSIGVNLDF